MQRTEEGEGRAARCLVSAAVGGILSLIVCILILLAFSAIVLSGKLPGNLVHLLTVVGAAVASFAGALFAAKRAGERYLLTGVASGLVFFLILTLVGILLYDGFSFHGGLGIFFAALLSGALGGVMGGNVKRKRKK